MYTCIVGFKVAGHMKHMGATPSPLAGIVVKHPTQPKYNSLNTLLYSNEYPGGIPVEESYKEHFTS